MSHTPSSSHLDNLIAGYLSQGLYEPALALIEQLCLERPTDPFVFFDMGNILIRLNRPHQAIRAYQNALRLNPNLYFAHLELGSLFNSLNQHAKALVHFRQAVKLRPGATSYYYLANTYQRLNRPQNAIPYFHKTLRLNPKHVNTLNNLGSLYCLQGKLSLALKYLQLALKNDPKHPDIHSNLGYLAEIQGQLNHAVKSYRRAIALNPRHYIALSNLSVILFKQGHIQTSQRLLKKALKLNPNYGLSHFRLGITYQALDQFKKAIASFEKCVELKPGFAHAYSYIIYLSLQICDWKKSDSYIAQMDKLIQQNQNSRLLYDPFIDLLIHSDPKQNLQPAKNHSDLVDSRVGGPHRYSPLVSTNLNHKQKKSIINLGYISKDFNHHPTGHLITPLFSLHHRDRFHIHTFSYGTDDGSTYRQEIEGHSDTFTDISTLNHHQAEQAIKDKHVNILIDIAVHTALDRPEILAFRPAPIQISYLAFPGSSGSSFFDYLIADPNLIPQSQLRHFSEKIIYLPHTYQITSPNHPIDHQQISPHTFHLPPSAFVFTAFNQYAKIEPTSFSIWMNLLRAIPNSVLWMVEHNHFAPINLRKAAQQQGIHPNRLIFCDSLPKANHLSRHSLANLALDTFTYNGHTTTSDALMMGLPVVTLQGTHFASRVASSLLTSMGLPELITHSLDDYYRLALHLATHPKKLNRIRKSLFMNLKSYPLFDTDRFTRNLETAYLTVWDNYLAGKSPQPFNITDPLPLIHKS